MTLKELKEKNSILYEIAVKRTTRKNATDEDRIRELFGWRDTFEGYRFWELVDNNKLPEAYTELLKVVSEKYPKGTLYKGAKAPCTSATNIVCRDISYVGDPETLHIHAGLSYLYYKGDIAQIVETTSTPPTPVSKFPISRGELRVGRLYESSIGAILYYGKDVDFGFDTGGSWFRCPKFNLSGTAFRKYNSKDWEEKLRQEAARRGFVEGAVYDSLKVGDYICEPQQKITDTVLHNYTTLTTNNGVLFHNGEWANSPKKITKAASMPSEVKFEIGKWYKSPNLKSAILYQGSLENCVGMFNGSWKDFWSIQDFYIEMTNEEVIDFLREEAEKRYKIGDVVEGLFSRMDYQINSFNYILDNDYFYISGTTVLNLKTGEWAKVIKKDETSPKLNPVDTPTYLDIPEGEKWIDLTKWENFHRAGIHFGIDPFDVIKNYEKEVKEVQLKRKSKPRVSSNIPKTKSVF